MKDLTNKQIAMLKNLYYKERNLFGRDKLFDLIKNEPNHPSQVQVNDWLKKQKVHQLFQKQKRSNILRPIIASKPNSFYQADLVDMGQNYIYKGNRYIFTMIDVFSRQAFAVALKNKDAKSVSQGLSKLLNQVKNQHKHIETLQTDHGGEFVNPDFKKVLNHFKVEKHALTIPGKPMTNGIIERFNGTLKSLIKKDLYARNTDDWVTPLPTYINNYNNSLHGTLKFTPNKADDNEESKQNVLKKARKRYANTINPTDIQVGDEVRLKKQKGKLEKHSDINWSKGVYIVEKIIKPKTASYIGTKYIINGKKNSFSRNDLLFVPEVQFPPAGIVEKMPGEYTIEKIIEMKPTKVTDANGDITTRNQYLVKYLGYNKKKDQRWHLFDDIKDTEAYEVFRKQHGFSKRKI